MPLPDAAVRRGEEAEGSEQHLAIIFFGLPPLLYLSFSATHTEACGGSCMTGWFLVVPLLV